MALSGNKGEWSEVYVLLKLLGDRELALGDENLNKIEGLVYPILEILRHENYSSIKYSVSSDIIIKINDEEVGRVPVLEFIESAKHLFSVIKSSSGNFRDSYTEEFLNKIFVGKLKASSSDKTDLTIVIHDQKTQVNPSLGFSIKSQLGSPSTLLNASRATNFIYKVNGPLNNEIKKQFNAEQRFVKRFDILNQSTCHVEFLEMDNAVFKNNLILVDSKLPEIFGYLIYLYYSTGESNLKRLVDIISEKDPIGFGKQHGHPFYEYKMKRFLSDYALGMMASKVWKGEYESTGGYLVVKANGDVLCYHFYYKNQFEDYLLSNTKLETASTTRHDFGMIYKQRNDYILKLNLQIRFII